MADSALLERLRLRLPLVAAPMFLVSGRDLVVAACVNGVLGCFPTANCRSALELDSWLQDIGRRLGQHEERSGQPASAYCPNLIVHRSNPRLKDDLDVVLRHKPAVVITSVGSPEAVLPALHDCGILVLSDVASLRHAERAISAGADGLVLLTAGAGGQTGWLNPFAFVRAVRASYDGPLVLAGGLSDGHALYAAQVLGCDLGYMGTRFIATRESLATDDYKEMLVQSSADEILLSKAFTGLETNMLRRSIVRAGIDPDNLPARGAIDIATDINVSSTDNPSSRWKDIWSAGHSVSGVTGVTSVAELVAQVRLEYGSARSQIRDAEIGPGA